jgi:hypothetical protein
VGLVASQFLKHGYVVMTFNFRGAGESAGRTSWTGKAEIEDYATVAAFFVEFLSHLNAEFKTQKSEDSSIKIVLAGYSYGSLITSRLPDVPTMLKPLTSSLPSKETTEIINRAAALASQVNEDIAAAHQQAHRHNIGDEASRESFDHTLAAGCADESVNHDRGQHHGIRRSMDSVSKRLGKRFSRQSQVSKSSEDLKEPPDRTAPIPTIIPSFLLISPLLPPISSLTSLHIPFFSSSPSADTPNVKRNPSFVVFGGHDVFTSAKKLRTWCSELAAVNQKFRWVEISEAGHFWHEHGVSKTLASALGEWIGESERG